ncbi:MAG: hypothetical protein ABIJ47_06265 [Candidatus Bathyarchaeota archaeon]
MKRRERTEQKKRGSSRITILAGLITVFALSVVYTMALETTTMQTSSMAASSDRNQEIRYNVYGLINVERWRENIPKLQYRETGMAERHSQAVLEINEIFHNKDLPYDAAETIMLASYNGDSVDLVVINLLVSGLMSSESDRELLLGVGFNSVDIGVSYDDYRVCLVINYYERGVKD